MSSQKRKILYLCRGGNIAGAQRQLLYLLRGFDRNRFTPLVLCTEGGPFLAELENMHVSCRLWKCAHWRKFKSLFLRYRDAARLARLVAEQGVSLIHCSDFQFGQYMFRSARSANIPSVMHIRAPVDRRTAWKYRCAEATAVVAISRRVEMRLVQQAGVPQDKITLIHDAVDPDLFKPRNPGSDGGVLRRQYNTGDAVLVGIAGRVEPAKEQLGFVQIAREVLKETDKAMFFIIGEIKDPSYHSRLVRQIRNSGLGERIRFTGRREDMPKVLAGLDVFVSLSGGSVRYEAMMCGVPVICGWSRRPEESYCIRHGETGFLVPDRSVESVREVLLEVIADSRLRERVGRSAEAWARKHLTHAALVEGTQDLYERLLGK